MDFFHAKWCHAWISHKHAWATLQEHKNGFPITCCHSIWSMRVYHNSFYPTAVLRCHAFCILHVTCIHCIPHVSKFSEWWNCPWVCLGHEQRNSFFFGHMLTCSEGSSAVETVHGNLCETAQDDGFKFQQFWNKKYQSNWIILSTTWFHHSSLQLTTVAHWTVKIHSLHYQ